MNMTWVDVVVTLVDTTIGYLVAMWLFTRIIHPWLLIRDARRRIDRAFGETKRRRKAIHKR